MTTKLLARLESQNGKPLELEGNYNNGLVNISRIGRWNLIGYFSKTLEEFMGVLSNIGDFRFRGDDYKIKIEMGVKTC